MSEAQFTLAVETAAVLINALAVLFAVTLGVQANRSASAQAIEARRQAELAEQATILAYRPILLPVHEVDWLSCEDKHWWPIDQVYQLSQSEVPSSQVFRVAIRSSAEGVQRAALALRNVGHGPAIVTKARLWSASDLSGSLVGQTAIGAGETRVLLIDLRRGGVAGEALSPAGWALAVLDGSENGLDSVQPDRVYFLEVEFDDVFDEPGQYRIRAYFEPRGLGAWRVVSDVSERA